MSKAIVCGDRNWINKLRICDILTQLNISIVIQGECSGADLLAKSVARDNNMRVLSYPANWRAYGKAAGPIRNKLMLEQEPDMVIAFHNDIDKSKGTLNMLRQARKKDILCYLVTDSTMLEYN